MAAEGWNWIVQSTRSHYFQSDGRALCGKWMTFGTDHSEELPNDRPPCKECHRRAEKRAEKTR